MNDPSRPSRAHALLRRLQRLPIPGGAITPLPLLQMARARLLRRGAPLPVEAHAVRSWQIAPGHTVRVPPAYFLPGQLERVTGWAFMDEHPARQMHGGFEQRHGPTRALLLEDVLLVDGVLYGGEGCTHLSPRRRRVPQLHVDVEIDHAALGCSAHGNQYFGSWMMDDAPRHRLAEAHGVPVVTELDPAEHIRQYSAWLGIRPRRLAGAWLRQLVVFDDVGQNRDKASRAAAIRARLLHCSGPRERHPGVFVLRGTAGLRRVLRGERELAEHLARSRGLRILDPLAVDVPTIVATCAGAELVVGVEGSALVHATQLLGPGGKMVVLQPPDRFCAVYKHLADRDAQHFGFVVGTKHGEDFAIPTDEVERTIDLLPH
ncbi:MAG: glycosyltransferase family 61 protein [Nannocystaceae bacterium]|nr:glycosyltransferase family 61 protein [Nannocystaceae bacterium]